MASSEKLQGTDLVNCAKANAKQGLATAAQQCGYGDDTESFEYNLKQACQAMGVEIQQISDLITPQQLAKEKGSIEIAPDNAGDL